MNPRSAAARPRRPAGAARGAPGGGSGEAAAPRRIGLLNGPNLNVLGRREPAIYGSATYEDLLRKVEEKAASLGVAIDAFQSNHEGDLVERLQAWAGDASIVGVVVNAGGLTHTSVALRDAVLLLGCPVVEVHLSNPAAREPFRRRSLLSGVSRGVVTGLGIDGYLAAVEHLARAGAA